MVEQQRTDVVSESTSRSRLLAGKYEVIGEISRGAFGQILKVRQTGLDKIFAAKILAADAASQEAFKRLAREGQILTKLSHPNIVKVYSAAIDEESGFVVLMDCLDGQPLSRLIRDKKLTLPATVDIAKQMCSGLQYAHENGILHRDLKPSNVMVVTQNEQQQAILIDFGIAKVQDASQKLTQTGAVLGTPLYMSPEQLMGQPLDARSDVYSFGCVLYEMVTGQPPFPGENWVELAAKHHSQPVLSPAEHNRDIPFDLEQIVLKCMAKKPEQRYQSIDQVIEALDSIDFNVPVSQCSMMIKRWQAAMGIASRLAIVGGVLLLLAGAGWMVRDNIKRSNANHLSDCQNQEREIAKLIDDDISISDRQAHDAQKRLEQLIRTINADSPEASELPMLHVMLGKSYRIQGKYSDAISQLEAARALKDKADLPTLLPVELGMDYFGNHQFEAAIGALDPEKNGIEDPVRRAAWQWRAKAYFFKPETRSRDKNRRFWDANGQCVNVMIGLKEGKKVLSAAEAQRLFQCSLISATVLNRGERYSEFSARGQIAWGSSETLWMTDRMISTITAEKCSPVWMALYELAQAEVAKGLKHTEQIGAHLSKLDAYLSDTRPPANQFEKQETQLWLGYIRERRKQLGLI